MATLVKKEVKKEKLDTALVLRIGLAVGLSAVSGIMLLFAFQPYGLWPLAWIGFVPYLIAQHRILPRRLSALGPAVAQGVWLGPFFMRFFGVEAPWILQYLGVIIALVNLAACGGERVFHERTGYRWFVLQGVFNWGGFEMIRGLIPVTNTTAFMANTMALQPWIIQPIGIFSIYGLNLLVMLFNFAVAYIIISVLDKQRQPDGAAAAIMRPATVWMVGVIAATALWVGGSLLMLNSAPQNPETVRVATLQPYFETPGHFVDAEQQKERLQIISEQAREAAAQNAEVILTPELAFGFDPQVEYTDELKALAAETGAYIFVNYGVDTGEGWRNEAVLLSPEGEFGEVYGKNHVFPGEPRIITAGVYPVNETPVGRLASIICHDANFTDSARHLARNGAQLVSVGSFEWSGFSEHKYTHAIMRAVENRVAVIKADSSYSSAIIDPYGRIIQLSVLTSGGQQILVDDVPLGTGQTVTSRLGDWLGWAALAGLIGFTVYMSVEKRNAKQATS
jgi:apolipoprotein N-acyltransferase